MTTTILLADDSVTIQKVVELTFMDQDYRVVAVGDGTDAVSRLEEVSPDLVIADVHMPGASGYDVCREVKRSSPQVPVLLLVGTFEPFDEDEVRSCGADAHLKKPFDSQELLRLAEELVGSGPRGGAAEAAAPAGSDEEAAAAEPPAPESTGSELPPPPAVEAPTILEAAAGRPAEGVAAEVGEVDGDLAAEVAGETTDSSVETDLEAAGPAIEEDEEEDPTLVVLEAAEFAESEAPDVGLAPEPGEEQEGLEAPGDELEIPDTPADAPLEVVGEPVPGAEVEPEVEPEVEEAGADVAPPAGPAPLSEEDIDRVAHRIVELLGDRVVREVAWEVLPDLAEVVVRERLRELESQVD